MNTARHKENSVHPGIRRVVGAFRGVPAEDGAGVKLTRIIGSSELNMWDPFLLLDRFESDNPDDYIAGFPPHPHRGFETVTYLLAGRLRHKDSTGREGVIEPGGVQWMTAGRGIVHSEMPEQVEGRLAGFQLWLNLPARDKLTAPRYQEFDADAIPLERRGEEVSIRVIAGQTSGGTRGPVVGVPTSPRYLDIELRPDGVFSESVPADHAAFAYVIDGGVEVLAGRDVNDRRISAGTLALLGEGDRIQLSGTEPRNRLLLVNALRLEEPVARSGPFVMNTRDEIMQAYSDYQAGRF
ncbi:MAG TPA: pirin family protein [Gammaproteobacteria bacterium]|nr:pirin family protein [Gammaproteobacteria bacterium]